MSPEEICPKCGNKRMFHEDELEQVRAGEIVCMECALDQGYHEFLGEVLGGEHKELIEELQERLEDEQ